MWKKYLCIKILHLFVAQQETSGHRHMSARPTQTQDAIHNNKANTLLLADQGRSKQTHIPRVQAPSSTRVESVTTIVSSMAQSPMCGQGSSFLQRHKGGVIF